MNFRSKLYCMNYKYLPYVSQLALALSLGICSTAFSQLIPSKAEDISPLLIGETIQGGTLLTMDGVPIKFPDVIKKRKTILIFYRGGWCPYCNAHLSEVGKIERELDALGYQVIAISPDAPSQLRPTQDKNEFKYQLLSDQKGDLMKAMGIAFKAPSASEKFLLVNQPDKDNLILPVPSLFIIDKSGEILFEFINPNYQHRISGYLLLAAAKTIAAEK